MFECPSCGNKIGIADLLKPGTFSKRLTMGVGAEYVPEQGIPCEISPQQARANALQLVRSTRMPLPGTTWKTQSKTT